MFFKLLFLWCLRKVYCGIIYYINIIWSYFPALMPAFLQNIMDVLNSIQSLTASIWQQSRGGIWKHVHFLNCLCLITCLIDIGSCPSYSQSKTILPIFNIYLKSLGTIFLCRTEKDVCVPLWYTVYIKALM